MDKEMLLILPDTIRTRIGLSAVRRQWQTFDSLLAQIKKKIVWEYSTKYDLQLIQISHANILKDQIAASSLIITVAIRPWFSQNLFYYVNIGRFSRPNFKWAGFNAQTLLENGRKVCETWILYPEYHLNQVDVFCKLTSLASLWSQLKFANAAQTYQVCNRAHVWKYLFDLETHHDKILAAFRGNNGAHKPEDFSNATPSLM